MNMLIMSIGKILIRIVPHALVPLSEDSTLCHNKCHLPAAPPLLQHNLSVLNIFECYNCSYCSVLATMAIWTFQHQIAWYLKILLFLLLYHIWHSFIVIGSINLMCNFEVHLISVFANLRYFVGLCHKLLFNNNNEVCGVGGAHLQAVNKRWVRQNIILHILLFCWRVELLLLFNRATI